MALECKLVSFDEESCRLVGEIVNVCADERILDDNGKIDLNKFSPITYDPVHHTYRMYRQCSCIRRCYNKCSK